MSTLLSQLRTAVLASMPLPSHVFFSPNESFWSCIQEVQAIGVTLVECGSGFGAVLDEAAARGIDMEGFDVAFRDGQSKRVRWGDATTLDWSPTTWPLICRPSHDGWANDVIDRARSQGAGVIFVGKPENYSRDLRWYRTNLLHRGSVGQDGEHIYLIKPQASKLS